MEKDNFKIKNFFDELFTSKRQTKQEDNESETNRYFDVLLKEFYDTSNMRLKADLTKQQIFLLTRATVFSDIYKSDVMKKTIAYILEYSVSTDRKGRIEFNDVFKFANDMKANSLNGNYDNALAGLLGFGRRV